MKYLAILLLLFSGCAVVPTQQPPTKDEIRPKVVDYMEKDMPKYSTDSDDLKWLYWDDPGAFFGRRYPQRWVMVETYYNADGAKQKVKLRINLTEQGEVIDAERKEKGILPWW